MAEIYYRQRRKKPAYQPDKGKLGEATARKNTNTGKKQTIKNELISATPTEIVKR